MTETVERSAPPHALLQVVNPMVRVLLRSPLHGPLDRSVLLLHVTGRKTGRRYDIPVSYFRSDGRLIVTTTAPWRVNLRGGAGVEVTWHGRRRPMHAELDEEPASVAVALESVIEQLGWPEAAHHLGITVHDDHRPTALELAGAASRHGWSVITLTAG